MRESLIAYDVCRHYLTDYATEFQGHTYRKIDGWLRSRNLWALATATKLVDVRGTLYSTKLIKHLLQVEAFFKKNASIEPETDLTEAALFGFELAEEKCMLANERLWNHYTEQNHSDLGFWVHRMQEEIDSLLGNIHPFLEEIPERVRFTGGATFDTARRKSQPFKKATLKPTCTRGALPLVEALAKHFGYPRPKPRITECNRVITVPKNWKTERTIACEPGGNIPFQLAFDSYAKDRLRKVGIDLSDQSSNQDFACYGSLTGRVATIDLEAASDSVSLGAVALLFPKEWYDFLKRVRSPSYVHPDGTIKQYHKFSSMGNGTTFAVETILFWSACKAVGSRNPRVYGDDIVIETELADDLIRLLDYLGFTVNEDKSFTSGPFRESCGSNWYLGEDVTPFYLREEGRSNAAASHIVNGLVRIGKPGGSLWMYCARFVRDRNLPLVPPSSVTTRGVQVTAHHMYEMSLFKTKKRYQRYFYRCYRNRPKSVDAFDSRSLFLWYLNTLRRQELSETKQTRVPVDSTYVRVWESYVVAPETPPHLYWWGDILTSLLR